MCFTTRLNCQRILFRSHLPRSTPQSCKMHGGGFFSCDGKDPPHSTRARFSRRVLPIGASQNRPARHGSVECMRFTKTLVVECSFCFYRPGHLWSPSLAYIDFPLSKQASKGKNPSHHLLNLIVGIQFLFPCSQGQEAKARAGQG